MSKIKVIEPLVKNILEENPEARKDDFKLIAEVYYRLNKEIGKLSFNVVMLGHKELKLPSVESITRARRKLQANYEYLRPDKKIEELRAKEKTEFRRYAKEI